MTGVQTCALPISTTGHYPVIENLPFSKVRTALRKNTLKRQRAWDAVAAATRPFYPQHSAVSQLEKSLLPAAMVALPFKKGRTPALLGKRVPGELQMTRSGSSIIPIRGISPDEWEQRGFQPLKFESALARVVAKRRFRSPPGPKLRLTRKGQLLAAGLTLGAAATNTAAAWGYKRKMQERVGLKKPLSVGGYTSRALGFGPAYFVGRGVAENRKRPSKKWTRKAIRQKKLIEDRGYEMQYAWRPGLRRFLTKYPTARGFRQFIREGVEARLLAQGPIERAMVGKKGETSARRAKEVVRKIAGEGASKRTQVKKVTGAGYFPGKHGKGRIVIPRNAPMAAHEASHAVQHKKLGKAFTPLMTHLPRVAGLTAFVTAHRAEAKDEDRKSVV